jgi:hypothetical protein
MTPDMIRNMRQQIEAFRRRATTVEDLRALDDLGIALDLLDRALRVLRRDPRDPDEIDPDDLDALARRLLPPGAEA